MVSQLLFNCHGLNAYPLIAYFNCYERIYEVFDKLNLLKRLRLIIQW